MKLFEQTSVGNITFKNRFFRASTWEDMADENGHMTDRLFKVYEELAKGGVGAILTGYAFVMDEERANSGMMGICDDSFISEYKKLTDMAHSYDTKIMLQIAYGGSMSTIKPPSKKIFGPSPVTNEQTGITPIEMTAEDIEQVTQAFVDAGIRAEKAGFDGVEIHIAHGYMLSLFLSPYFNKREDEYGGSIENRGRFMVNIIERLRKVVHKDFLLMAKVNSSDEMPEGQGLSHEDSIIFTQNLEKAGLDMVEISGGNASSAYVLKYNLTPARTKLTIDKESYFASHAKELKKAVDIPVILTGGNRNYDRLEELFTNDGIDFFAFSRPLLAEPDLINTWKENQSSKPKCISCNACFATKNGKYCTITKNN